LARNKYHTRLVLGRNNLPNIPYLHARAQTDAQNFLAQHGTVIAKPLRGSGSVNIHIIRRATQIKSLRVSEYILEKYLPGTELRYLVMRGKVIGVHESRYGASVAADRPLKRISYSQADWDPQLLTWALEAANVLGLSFAAIDFMITEDGETYILEVNSRPGFKWFHAPSEGPVVDVATQFLEALIA
jgi:D-alanine-D-alanine ligase